MRSRTARISLAVVLALTLVGGGVFAARGVAHIGRTHIVGYFDNSNGLFSGDEVRILGVPVGAIDTIEPQPERVKITFWVDDKYRVPANAMAAIVSPQLITSRAIQLTPAYSSGPAMADGAVIPESRTVVPLEWDDLRKQLDKLTDALQPTQPGGVSTLGAFINTAAGNLHGQGQHIRDTIIAMSQAFSALGDHSNDIFSTVKNLSVVVSALRDSSTLLRQLNRNLASVTALLAADPNAVGDAIKNLNAVVGEATSFIADNREALGTTTDKLSSISKAVYDSLDDIKQALHVFPNALQNFQNAYQPTQAAFTAELALQNFANPITFCAARYKPRRGSTTSSRRSCACSISHPSSKTASSTSCHSARTCSSVNQRAPTKSPTPRTGCAPTTSRLRPIRRLRMDRCPPAPPCHPRITRPRQPTRWRRIRPMVCPA